MGPCSPPSSLWRVSAEDTEHGDQSLLERVVSRTLASGEGKANTKGWLARWNYGNGDEVESINRLNPVLNRA